MTDMALFLALVVVSVAGWVLVFKELRRERRVVAV